MASSESDRTSRSPGARMLASIDEFVFKIESLFNLTSAFLILFLMLLAVAQVTGRKVFNMPVRGYVDWVELAMAIFCFLSIAYTQKLGGHVRMEFFIGRFKGRLLYAFEIIGTLIALFICVILMVYAYKHFQRAWTIGDSSMDIQLPIWPSKLLVAFAFLSLNIRLIIQFFGFTRLFLHPDAQPIGVPVIETVVEQAQKEIDTGLAGENEKVDIVSAGGVRK
jgi:C4-dicarboxylate transporter DctQ subunit